MQDIKTIADAGVALVKNNSSNILTATAVTGVFATSVLAAKGHTKAQHILTWEREEELPRNEQIKATWKCYAPAVTVGAITVASIVGIRYLDIREATVIAASYAVTERAFSEYKSKVAEKMPEKVEEIRESIAEDRMKATPASKLPAVVVRENDILCYDTYSGRYFASNKDEIDKCLNMLNQALVNDSWVSLNTWYSLVGLHNIQIGEEFGWNTDNLVDIQYGTTMADDGRPCLTVSFRIDPRADAYRVYG